MKEQFKASVKELYSSLHAPESLREKTFAAIEQRGGEKKKAKILEFNFKTLSVLAACLLLCFGLLLWGNLDGAEINIQLMGQEASTQAVVCHTSEVTYLPRALPMSAKAADNAMTAPALEIDVELDGRAAVTGGAAVLACEDKDGQLCEIGETADINGETVLYVLTNGAEEIEVIFTSHKEEKTLVISENSDGTYSVRIK